MPSTKEYQRAIEQAVDKTANLIHRDYRSTVATWEHKVTFTQTVDKRGGVFAIEVSTDDDIYGYVDRGTRPHVIRPKRARALRFRGGYRAKTRVGVIGSRQGGAFGATVHAMSVNHPGFPGRKFSETIRRRRRTTLQQEASQNIAKIARKAK